MPAQIFQLNSSPGGVPKLPVPEARVTELGLAGDDHRFPAIHGGPERALCLFSLDRILELQREGHPIYPGAVGENVTISGLDWDRMTPGRQLALGEEVLVEITRYTTPCKTIAHTFTGGNYERIWQKVHPGYSRVYARVLRPGHLTVGQTVRLLNGVEASQL
jgi:MOSC domain-containing protein YiiM